MVEGEKGSLSVTAMSTECDILHWKEVSWGAAYCSIILYLE